jgi:hypothetical protein
LRIILQNSPHNLEFQTADKFLTVYDVKLVWRLYACKVFSADRVCENANDSFSGNILCPCDEIKMAVLPYQSPTMEVEKVSKIRVLN